MKSYHWITKWYPRTIKAEEKGKSYPGYVRSPVANGDCKLSNVDRKQAGRAEKESFPLSKPECMPKNSADPKFQFQSCNPFGDTVSLAPTLQASGSASPRGSIISEDYQPVYHVVGKRRAPEPPGGTPGRSSPSIYSEGSKGSRRYPGSRKKGPAPPPPRAPGSTQSAPSTPAPTLIFPKRETKPYMNGVDLELELAVGQAERNKSLRSSHTLQPSQNDQAKVKSGLGMEQQERNDSWTLEDGVLRPLRESKLDLSGATVEEKDLKESKAPLSPKPWYKRSIRDTNEKKPKDKKEKKGTSPDNLPEIHTGRESIKVQESFEEKYSYFIRKAILRTLQFLNSLSCTAVQCRYCCQGLSRA